jgi:hypothetical protein
LAKTITGHLKSSKGNREKGLARIEPWQREKTKNDALSAHTDRDETRYELVAYETEDWRLQLAMLKGGNRFIENTVEFLNGSIGRKICAKTKRVSFQGWSSWASKTKMQVLDKC